MEQVAELMKKTQTKTGLRVVVRIVDKHYPIKQASSIDMINENRIYPHHKLNKLTYLIKVNGTDYF